MTARGEDRGEDHADDSVDEVSALIDLLHQTSARIEELTGGEVDTVTDREGRPFLLRHAQEHLRRLDESKQAAILNALPAHVAVLDPQGRIVSVNEAWRAFGRANGLGSGNAGVGMSYLDACSGDDEDAEAHRICAGVRYVLTGHKDHFSAEYACHSPDIQRWFLITVAPLSPDLRRGAVVMHVNVTPEREAAHRAIEGEQRFRQMADHINDVFFLQSSDFSTMYYVSPAYEQIWGRTCESLYANPASWGDAFHPDDLHLAAELVSRGDPAFDYEFRILRPSGEIRWIHVRGVPVLDEAGTPYRTAGIATDITERKAADARILHLSRVYAVLSGINTLIVRVRDREELFQEACRIAVAAGGFRMSLISVVDRVTGAVAPVASAGKDEGLMGQVAALLANPETASKTMVGRALRTKAPVVSNDSVNDPRLLLPTRYVESEVRSIAILPLLIADEAIGVLALYSSEVDFFQEEEMKLLGELANDIAFCEGGLRARDHKKKADEALHASLKEKEALLKEVHHRVKNNMQVITSLLRLESNRIDHPTTKSVLKDMQNRILAMASLHEALYRSNSFAQVDLASYLKELTTQLQRSLVVSPGQIAFHVDLLPVGLDLDQAIPCGLIVNELVSNALKHGFPDGRRGTVRVEADWVSKGVLRLRISDDGIGLGLDFAERRVKSLGLQLVADLSRQLGGSFLIGPGPGAVFEVTFQPGRQESSPPG